MAVCKLGMKTGRLFSTGENSSSWFTFQFGLERSAEESTEAIQGTFDAIRDEIENQLNIWLIKEGLMKPDEDRAKADIHCVSDIDDDDDDGKDFNPKYSEIK